MIVEFHPMEESLKDFLAESQSDRYHTANTFLYKYHNLKMYMDPKKSLTPHIIIRIGISEVIYELNSWKKISGGLGSDEKYILRWFHKNSTRFNFQGNWETAIKPKQAIVADDGGDDEF